MANCDAIAQVAVPAPFHHLFDYLLPTAEPPPCVGGRVLVPFGKRRVVGLVTGLTNETPIERRRLRAIETVLDTRPVLPEELLKLLLWASRYYHYPIGECLATALPSLLRRGRPAEPALERVWRIAPAGQTIAANALRRRAPRQARLLEILQQSARPIGCAELTDSNGDWRGALERLAARGWIAASDRPVYALRRSHTRTAAPTLNLAQSKAVRAITAALNNFQALLLEGVTGSGKTEVYLAAIEAVLAAGRQTLLLVPEIGLTPQLVARFTSRLDAPLAVLHSGLSDTERLEAWHAAGNGAAPIVIGTRSAVFAPLARPGLIVVDEEHDTSLKQQDGFRYSARDLAVVRARRLNIPIVLGSATPSLETLYNVRRGRYRQLRLPQRAGGAATPEFRIFDVRGKPLREGLSQPLQQRLQTHLDAGRQALLLLNRRGFAPTLLCHECGWIALCHRCDARLIYHHPGKRVRCHHCNYDRPVPAHCPHCAGPDLRPLGLGTQRVEAALRLAFPSAGLLRIDRDSTRGKGAFEARMAAAQRGEAQILLGTQMLAKGHHLPEVTLVAIIDADQGLFGSDFRAPERFAQLLIQVAGRAGRAAHLGEVVIQTHHPEHPLLQILIHRGYKDFAEVALKEREQAHLPPFSAMALLRAEAHEADTPHVFLAQAKASAQPAPGITMLGPVPAPMERRAGRYRAQLLLQTAHRDELQALLRNWVPRLAELEQARRVRWSVDVDPLETL
ncbi:primosomal protein N' [Nitrococcus mobilis]|uniref:Replication restart protein PriA n=1 Tax=Nitrococcus mobilis Nb-231 TaxID=314278 RepID=A4BMX7_9GAMM|nr:primosomal protein N' [Nitrococcus mobilis]EAR22576.1 Primosomal protein n [Nitrococcus mobilis Nb-231]